MSTRGALWLSALLWPWIGLGLSCGPGGSTGGTDLAVAACPNDLPATCPTPAPSYSTQIESIVTQRCVVCHGPGGANAGMPFDSYAAVFHDRTTVLTQVYGCVMPPAGATPLQTAERAALLSWLVCQAPDN